MKFVLNPIRLLPLVVLRIILEGELKEAIEMLLNHKDTNIQLKNIDGNTIFDFDMDYNPEVLELLNKHLK